MHGMLSRRVLGLRILSVTFNVRTFTNVTPTMKKIVNN